MSSLQKKLFNSKGLPPRPLGPPRSSRFQKKMRDFTFIPWSNYFDTEGWIEVSSSTKFHYYQKGEFGGPIILFLHGGGFSGLSWAMLSQSLTSFVQCCCVAVDQRGHGSSKTEDDLKLTADQLADDIGEIISSLLNSHQNVDSSTPIILVGHSMGGAVAVHAAAKDKIPNLVGLVVIDVVEGSALESLHAMRGVLSNRPKTFESIEKANEWCIKTGYIRNSQSARVSMAGQLVKLETPIEVPTRHYSESGQLRENTTMEAIKEDEGARESAALSTSNSENVQKTTKTHNYGWRIDLSKTSHYWEGWFKGMSSMFLSVTVPKLLLLAGVDRLDAQMTTAQMQGKFQMHIVAKSGHAVHEDAPDKVAEVIASFLIRHKFAESLGDFKRPMPAC